MTGPRAAFRVAVAPGVTVQKWVSRWAERSDAPIAVVPVPEAAGVAVLHRDEADVSFVRLPVDREGLSLIPLWEETPVVVVPQEHLLTAAERVALADLTGETLLQDPGAVPAWAAALTPLGPADDVEVDVDDLPATLALVAAGVGVVVVPQSLARLHHRKDLTYRPVTDLAPVPVGVAWLEDRTTADVETFIGIVRGRTARSSRGGTAEQDPGTTAPATGAAASGRRATPARPTGPRRPRPPAGRRGRPPRRA